jgi:cytochrome b involved in lipid metabolism
MNPHMKKIAIVVSILAMSGFGLLLTIPRSTRPSRENAPETPYTSPSVQETASSSEIPETPSVTPTDTRYTLAQIGAHATSASCWTSIAGSVYDLTPWISQHPGGSRAILSLCGSDGTEAFARQHGGQARPEQELARFYIGTLQQ